MSKVIFTGLESSGKSLQLAMTAVKILNRNILWKKESGIARAIISNLNFSKDFEKIAKENGIPVIYWTTLDELIKFRDADIFIDEIGNYFDSRLWSDLSLDTRRWLSQGAKMGIEIYGSAQDFAQVDKAFRRLVNELYFISKLIGSPRPSPTKPPVKKIWGLCVMRILDPQNYNEDRKVFESDGILPKMFLIREKFCNIFDTLQFIERSKAPALRHIERECEDAGCDFKKISHV